MKFSRDADTRQIDIDCHLNADNKVELSIRDYGPGIGEPVSWAPEPTANLWSSGLDYIKLTFTRKHKKVVLSER